MPRTDVHFKGGFETLQLKEPFDATGQNMSAASNSNMIFFHAHDMSDQRVLVAIKEVQYLREVSHD